MMGGRIYNEDSFDVLMDIANECVEPVLVTDPPFNVGYHYRSFNDRMDESEYFGSMAQMFNEYPSVVVLYPEALHRLSHEMGRMPDRVVSWVYPSNTRRQHRDIGFYGIEPVFDQVRKPYRNPNDKRIRELVKRTGGGSLLRLARSQPGQECIAREDRAPVPDAAGSHAARYWLAPTICYDHRSVCWERHHSRGSGDVGQRVAGDRDRPGLLRNYREKGRGMECEVYILSDGKCQCGNCGEVMESVPDTCEACGATVVSVVDEGDGDGACEAALRESKEER